MPNIATAEAALSERDVIEWSPGATLPDSGMLVHSEPRVTVRLSNIQIEQLGRNEHFGGWVRPTLEALDSKLQLAPNWDSHGALPIDKRRVFNAIRVLFSTMSSDTEAPWVVPTTDGGIQLEWHREDKDLEVEISGGGDASIFFHNARTGEEWEISLAENIPRLRSLLAQWITG